MPFCVKHDFGSDPLILITGLCQSVLNHFDKIITKLIILQHFIHEIVFNRMTFSFFQNQKVK